MISLNKELIGLKPGYMLPIRKWVVMFKTPYGMCGTINDAREMINQILQGTDQELLQDGPINIENLIKPVTVAFDEFDYSEIVER